MALRIALLAGLPLWYSQQHNRNIIMHEPYYTPSEILTISRQVEGIKIYLGGAESAFHSALGDAYSRESAFCGDWSAEAHNDVILPDSEMGESEDDSNEDDEEIYGVVFYGDCNSMYKDGDTAVDEHNVNNDETDGTNHNAGSSSSDESSEMSEELMDFAETRSVDYAAEPCIDDLRRRSTKRGRHNNNMESPSDDSAQRIAESLVFESEASSVDYASCNSNDSRKDSLEHDGSLTSNFPLRDGHKNTSRTAPSCDSISHYTNNNTTCSKSDFDHDISTEDNVSQDQCSNRHQYSNNYPMVPIETYDKDKPSSLRNNEPPSTEIWHSRRTSSDVIKKRTQLKRDKAAASIHKQYKRITSFRSNDEMMESNGVAKRPKLMFMAAPGMKDKKKKQMTLMGMFKK